MGTSDIVRLSYRTNICHLYYSQIGNTAIFVKRIHLQDPITAQYAIYYLMAVLYIMIGSLYASVLQWPHIIESIGGFHWMSLMCMIAPHIAVLGGFLSIYGFICAVSQIVLASVFVLTAFLLFVQMKCIFNGQTIHEKKAEITLYDLGWKKNFVQVLGKNWYLAILSPFASSPVDGDGVNFMTFYDLSEIKNV
ncbi:palmitoyltransferase [Trichonephila clavipes]|nr:palmitoyltransferase [Trichonephila clavipes]